MTRARLCPIICSCRAAPGDQSCRAGWGWQLLLISQSKVLIKAWIPELFWYWAEPLSRWKREWTSPAAPLQNKINTRGGKFWVGQTGKNENFFFQKSWQMPQPLSETNSASERLHWICYLNSVSQPPNSQINICNSAALLLPWEHLTGKWLHFHTTGSKPKCCACFSSFWQSSVQFSALKRNCPTTAVSLLSKGQKERGRKEGGGRTAENCTFQMWDTAISFWRSISGKLDS